MSSARSFVLVMGVLVGCGGAASDSRDGGAGADGASLDGAASTADSGEGDAGGTGDVTTDPEAFAAAFAEAACDHGRRCESLNPLASQYYCHPGYEDIIWTPVLAAWRSGRGMPDPDAIRACLAAIREEGCSGHFAALPPEACFGVVVGTVPDGGECFLGLVGPLSFECQPGLTCISEGECPGRCGVPSAEGEACSPARACARGSSCIDGTCVDMPGLGEPCGGASHCEFPLRCVEGECIEGQDVGDPCGPSTPCRWASPELRCLADESGESTCTEWLGAEGEVCNASVDVCQYPLVCAVPPGGQGTCTTGEPFGAACDAAAPCGLGGRCVDGLCREIVSPDGQCDATRVCPLTHRCVDGNCIPLPTEGEACDSDGCLLNRCEAGICVQPNPTAGEPCHSRLWHCAPGYHCADVDGAYLCRAPCD